jgi:hypothetical protein
VPQLIVQSGLNSWRLEFDDGLLDAARAALAKSPENPKDSSPSGPGASVANGTTRDPSATSLLAPGDTQITTLAVRLATEKPGGPPPTTALVKVKGQDLLNQSIEGTKLVKDTVGPIDFGELLPGNYSFEVSGPFGRTEFVAKVIRGEANVIEVVCPPTLERAEMKLELPVPSDLADKQVVAVAEFEAMSYEIQERTWQPRAAAIVLSNGESTEFFALRSSSGRSFLEQSRVDIAQGRPGIQDRLRPLVGPPNQSFTVADDGIRPLGLHYRLLALGLTNDPRQMRSRSSEIKTTVSVLRIAGRNDWPKSLDEPFEFTAGKTWKIAIPDEMLQSAREQISKLEATQ